MGKSSPSKSMLGRLKFWVLGLCRLIRIAYQTPIPFYPLEREMRFLKLRGVVLRAYHPDDFEACRLIHDLNAPHRFPEESSRQHEKYLRESPQTNLVAELDHRVIGCGGIVLQHPDCATFVYGLVHPKYQRQGVGRMLFFGRVALLPELEKDTIILIHAVKSSLPYYQRFGFVPLEEGWKDEAGHEHPTAVTAVNAEIIRRTKTYLRIHDVTLQSTGPPIPLNERLLSDLSNPPS